MGDEHFLEHLERLANAQADAERDRIRLVQALAAAQARLKLAVAERDSTAQRCAQLASVQLAHQSSEFELSALRSRLQDKLHALLVELCLLESDAPSSPMQCNDTALLEELNETRVRLEEGAIYFDGQQQHQVAVLPQQQQVGLRRFELERAKRKAEAKRRECAAMHDRLRQVLQNEASLKAKLESKES